MKLRRDSALNTSLMQSSIVFSSLRVLSRRYPSWVPWLLISTIFIQNSLIIMMLQKSHLAAKLSYFNPWLFLSEVLHIFRTRVLGSVCFLFFEFPSTIWCHDYLYSSWAVTFLLYSIHSFPFFPSANVCAFFICI